MPSFGESVTVSYTAWDTNNNVPKTGDAANHTLKWVKNGTAAATTNAPSEVSGGGGTYLVTITATEAQTVVGTICGVSSTANVVIVAKDFSFERLPTVALASSGGLPTVGTGNGQINCLSGVVDANVAKIAGDPAFGSDGSLSAATSSTVTFAATDSAGNAVPDDNRFANCIIKLVGGAGIGQMVVTTTKAASPARTFNVLAGTMPVTPDSTTKYVVVDSDLSALTPTGLDYIPTTAPAGVASTFREMVVQSWRRFFKKTTKDRATLTVKTYADDNTTVVSTQTFADDGSGTESLTAAS